MIEYLFCQYNDWHSPADLLSDEIGIISTDIVKAVLIGTLLDREGERRDVFKRTLESVPEIDSQCFIMAGEVLTSFMGHPLLVW